MKLIKLNLFILIFSLNFSIWASERILPDFTTLVAANGPTVVNISTKQVTSSNGHISKEINPDLQENNPWRDFFRRFFNDESDSPGDLDGRSLGSGFIISSDGYILTNAHVVAGSDEILVRTSDRREFVASLIGSDTRSDVALLKVAGAALPVVQIGSSQNLLVGAWVLAIGSPFGFEASATAGIVSAKGRNLPTENYIPFIQTDVAINPGNSGGPLFNLDGQVIGVNSQIYSRTGGFMGLSFAIPIEFAMDVAEQLKTKGRVSRGWIGVLVQDLTHELAETFGLQQPQGALVAQVLPNSPAAAVGLRPGDILLRFNNHDLLTSSALPPLVGMTAVGSQASLQLLRGGESITMMIKVEELPDETSPSQEQKAVTAGPMNRLGLALRDLNHEEKQALGEPTEGVVIEDLAEGLTTQTGLQEGDVILQFNHHDVKNLADFNKLLAACSTGQRIAVLIQHGDNRVFHALQVP